MRVKEEKEKAGLKLNIKIKKNKLRSCHVDPSVNGKIDGGKVEAVTDTLSLGSKITVDIDCSYEVKDACSLEKSYDKPRQLIQKEETSLC